MYQLFKNNVCYLLYKGIAEKQWIISINTLHHIMKSNVLVAS